MGLAYGAADQADAGYPRRVAYLIDPAGKVKKAVPKADPKTIALTFLKEL